MTGDEQGKWPARLHWKYWARLTFGPPLARLGRLLGLDWVTLGERIGREVLIEQVRQIGPPKVIRPVARPLNIVCLPMIGGTIKTISTELVLGRALLARGHRVRFVLCDNALPACENKKDWAEDSWPYACAKCYQFGRRYLENAGLEVLKVSELVRGFADDGRWPEFVESAMLKHHHVGVLPDTPETAARQALFVESARISARLGKALLADRPDRVLMSHGLYCTWGPVREVLVKAGMPVAIYSDGRRRDTLRINWTLDAAWWDVSAEWERVKDIPLRPDQEKVLDGYLQSRRTHSQDAIVYNLGREETVEQTRRRFGLDPAKTTFALFTNVLWDGASAQRELAFNSPIAWVCETIAWFARHPDRQLVVKIHPAEAVWPTNQPFAAVIAEAFPRLPENVRVIQPREKTNSWSVLAAADLALMHTSTVGLEAALEGIPCAVVSRTYYRDKGFTIDVSSAAEYFDLIEQWKADRVDREAFRTRARRFAYLLFERSQIPFPFHHEKRVGIADVRALVGVGEAELLAHPGVRLICRALENQEDFVLPA